MFRASRTCYHLPFLRLLRCHGIPFRRRLYATQRNCPAVSGHVGSKPDVKMGLSNGVKPQATLPAVSPNARAARQKFSHEHRSLAGREYASADQW